MKKKIESYGTGQLECQFYGLGDTYADRQNDEDADRCQIDQFGYMLRIQRKWHMGEDWLGFHKRKVHVANIFAMTVGKGLISQCYLVKHWNWNGHVARMDQNKWAFKTSTWASQQWKRCGTSSKVGKPIYAKGFRWAVKGLHAHWIYERRVDEFCKAQGEEWMILAQDREKWRALAPYFAQQFNYLNGNEEDWKIDMESRADALTPHVWSGENVAEEGELFF